MMDGDRAGAEQPANRLYLIGKNEAQSTDCVQGKEQIGLFRSATQATDYRVDPRIVKFVDVFTHSFHKRDPIDSLSTVTEQAFQNTPLRTRQAKAMPHIVAKHPAPFYQRPLQGGRRRGSLMQREALMESDHRRGQFSQIDGLDQIGVSTLLKPVDAIVDGTSGRCHDDTDGPRGSQMPGYGEAVFTTIESDIEDDNVGGPGRVGSVEVRGALKPMCLHAKLREAGNHLLAEIRVILNEIDERGARGIVLANCLFKQ